MQIRKPLWPSPETHNLSIVVLRGKPVFNGKERANAGEPVGFGRIGGEVRIRVGNEAADLLPPSGVPIDGPMAGYGPFVMNTAEEIRQAFADFRNGRFSRID